MAIVRFFQKLGSRVGNFGMGLGGKNGSKAKGVTLDPLQTVGARRLYEVLLPYLNDRPILTAHHWAGAGGESMDFRTVARGGDESGARALLEAMRCCLRFAGATVGECKDTSLMLRHSLLGAIKSDLARFPDRSLARPDIEAIERCARNTALAASKQARQTSI